MKVFLWLVLAVFLAFSDQALAQGPGFAEGLSRGLDQGHRHRMERERLQMEEELARAQIRQMELENQLNQLRIREQQLRLREQELRMQQMELDNQARQRALSGSADAVAPR